MRPTLYVNMSCVFKDAMCKETFRRYLGLYMWFQKSKSWFVKLYICSDKRLPEANGKFVNNMLLDYLEKQNGFATIQAGTVTGRCTAEHLRESTSNFGKKIQAVFVKVLYYGKNVFQSFMVIRTLKMLLWAPKKLHSIRFLHDFCYNFVSRKMCLRFQKNRSCEFYAR